MRVIVIKADTNDADYVTSETKVADYEEYGEDVVGMVKRVAEAIRIVTAQRKAKSPTGYINFHNWDTGCFRSDSESPSDVYAGLLSDDDIEFFNDIAPAGHGYGIHTIASIRIVEITDEERVL